MVDADWQLISFISFEESMPCCFFILLSTLWTIPSTMITAPSTIIPKSMAPKLIRFAQTPNILIKMKAKSKDSGITDAVISPPRMLPNNKTKTKITISAPSIKFLAMVLVVRSIKLDRSRNGLISMSLGNDF